MLWSIKWYSPALIWGFISLYISIASQYNPTVSQENTSDWLFAFHFFQASPIPSVQCKNQIFTFVNITGHYLTMKHLASHCFIFAVLWTQQWHTLVKPVLSQLHFWKTSPGLWFSVICRSRKEYGKCIICIIHKSNILLPKSSFFLFFFFFQNNANSDVL